MKKFSLEQYVVQHPGQVRSVLEKKGIGPIARFGIAAHGGGTLFEIIPDRVRDALASGRTPYMTEITAHSGGIFDFASIARLGSGVRQVNAHPQVVSASQFRATVKQIDLALQLAGQEEALFLPSVNTTSLGGWIVNGGDPQPILIDEKRTPLARVFEGGLLAISGATLQFSVDSTGSFWEEVWASPDGTPIQFFTRVQNGYTAVTTRDAIYAIDCSSVPMTGIAITVERVRRVVVEIGSRRCTTQYVGRLGGDTSTIALAARPEHTRTILLLFPESKDPCESVTQIISAARTVA